MVDPDNLEDMPGTYDMTREVAARPYRPAINIHDQQDEIIDCAAILLSGRFTDTGKTMLQGAMDEVAMHSRGGGIGARDNWLAALDSLGDTCKSIAKREKNKYK